MSHGGVFSPHGPHETVQKLESHFNAIGAKKAIFEIPVTSLGLNQQLSEEVLNIFRTSKHIVSLQMQSSVFVYPNSIKKNIEYEKWKHIPVEDFQFLFAELSRSTIRNLLRRSLREESLEAMYKIGKFSLDDEMKEVFEKWKNYKNINADLEEIRSISRMQNYTSEINWVHIKIKKEGKLVAYAISLANDDSSQFFYHHSLPDSTGKGTNVMAICSLIVANYKLGIKFIDFGGYPIYNNGGLSSLGFWKESFGNFKMNIPVGVWYSSKFLCQLRKSTILLKGFVLRIHRHFPISRKE